MLAKIPIVFHNGSNYDYHFIIKELAEEFKKQYICLGENTEKYIIFTVPIEKEVTRIDKNGEEITKNISKYDKYKYLTGEEILSSDQKNVINQAKFAYSPLEKAFEMQTKTNEVHGKTTTNE